MSIWSNRRLILRRAPFARLEGPAGSRRTPIERGVRSATGGSAQRCPAETHTLTPRGWRTWLKTGRPTGPLVRKGSRLGPSSRLECARPRQIRRAAMADMTPEGAARRAATVYWPPSFPVETPFEPPPGPPATPAARRLGIRERSPASPWSLSPVSRCRARRNRPDSEKVRSKRLCVPIARFADLLNIRNTNIAFI